jgi:uncharacterized protein YggE
MRRFLMLCALLPLPLVAQTGRDSVISVSAVRTTKVAPDRASFYLIVEGSAETPNDAIARVDSKVQTIVAALKGFGSHVTLDPPLAYGVGANPIVNGYNGMAQPPTNLARSVIHVQMDQPGQIAKVIAAGIAAGATSSSLLTFESSVADSVRRARIGDALGSARQDAEAIAASLGAHLGALVSVNTSGGNFGFQGPSMLAFDNRYGQQAPPPEITISTNVTVQYRLVH